MADKKEPTAELKNLKALAYDMIAHIERLQQELKAQIEALQSVNQQIQEVEVKEKESEVVGYGGTD